MIEKLKPTDDFQHVAGLIYDTDESFFKFLSGSDRGAAAEKTSKLITSDEEYFLYSNILTYRLDGLGCWRMFGVPFWVAF